MSETGQVLQTTGGTEKIDVSFTTPLFSLPLSSFIVHACHSLALVLISFTSKDDLFWLLIQPPGVRSWSQFLFHPSCHFLQVYNPALLHRCWKPASISCGSRGVLKRCLSTSLLLFFLLFFLHLCLGSVDGINDLRWDLPSTAPTSCNTAFALVLSDVGSSAVHPNQVFPGT